MCFFFNDTATTEIYTLSLHDALPISRPVGLGALWLCLSGVWRRFADIARPRLRIAWRRVRTGRSRDRKSTRLKCSHVNISYAVFCLKKKNILNLLLYLASHHIRHSRL